MSDSTPRAAGGRAPSGVDRSRGAEFTHRADEASSSPGNPDKATIHRLQVDPSRSMKAITAEVDTLLDGRAEASRHSAGLLASELIAQVVGAAPDWNSQRVGLTVQVRADAVRLEATGPVVPAIKASAAHDGIPDDTVAAWGVFLIERLADRWGFDGGARRMIWAEIETPRDDSGPVRLHGD